MGTKYLDKDGIWRPVSSLENIILPLNYAKEEKMEFKLLIEERSKTYEIQRKLNQWNHQYVISILGMCAVGTDSLAVLVQRFNKPKKREEERRSGDGC